MNKSKLDYSFLLSAIFLLGGFLVLGFITLVYVIYPTDIDVEGFVTLFGRKIAYNTNTDKTLGLIQRIVQLAPIDIVFVSFVYGILQDRSKKTL
jgi:hypothetical protein